ncbi:MAG: hypothetical protein KJ043_10695 [Anaerolineae bacterium]|nr:hypothetical protein [Anaerolineae bacterium]
MANRDYVLDTNIVSALLRMSHPKLILRLSQHKREALILCDCIIYEIERGLTRLNGVLVTDDQDFQYLPIQTENWLRDT